MNITNIGDKITCEEELRTIIKSYPKILDKRIQPTLDKYSIEFITQSPLAALTFSDLSLGMPFLNLKNCRFSIESPSTLSFLVPITSELTDINNMPCSLYFLIPGVGHGLRINGKADRIKPTDGKELEIRVALNIQSVYLHCARAITRAELWETPQQSYNSTVNSIIKNSPYVLLSTQDAMGNTELSPRGDPAGFVRIINENNLLLPERPGNKVAVSLTNIINNPAIALSFLVPGSNKVLYIVGNAHITTDQILLKPLAIKGKVPKIGISILINSLTLNDSAVLESTEIWKKERHISSKSLTTFSKALTAHMQGEGLLGKLSNPIISGIIQHDMNNLY
jgi:uncharacterized protein